MMRCKFVGPLLLFSCVLPLTGLPQDSPGSEAPLRVLTYNIRYDNPGDGINAWPNRRDFVAELIGRRCSAGLVGLQEALFSQVVDLADRLEDYQWVGVGRDDGWKAGEFTPVFFRPDRLELLQQNTFWLSEQPEMPGSKSWDAAITRIATWVRFRDRKTGRIFYFFNTHFDHRGERARQESARLLLERISEIAAGFPVILCGDLNFPESSPGYSRLTGRSGRPSVELQDCRYVAERGHEGPTASTNNWLELRPPGTRIDYVFVSPDFRVETHRIVDERHQGRFPSDHLPVLVEMGFR